jgi:hypothetical protein
MIFISRQTPDSVVFFAALMLTPPFGDLMKKSATLISTALLAFGLAAASMAADAPKTGTPAAADSSAPATSTKSHKHAAKKHKKASTAAPAASK